MVAVLCGELVGSWGAELTSNLLHFDRVDPLTYQSPIAGSVYRPQVWAEVLTELSPDPPVGAMPAGIPSIVRPEGCAPAAGSCSQPPVIGPAADAVGRMGVCGRHALVRGGVAAGV